MSVIRVLAAATAAIAVGVAAGQPARAAQPAHSAQSAEAASSDWTSDPLPLTAANLVGAAQPRPGVTWAAGFTLSTKTSPTSPVLLTRRDGDSRGWVRTPTAPLPAGTRTRFNAVTAVSADDGWLVGDGSSQVGGIVTEHWDGTAWKLLPAPEPAGAYDDSDGFLSVSARGACDAWAAGWNDVLDSVGTDPSGLPVYNTHLEGAIEHWDGSGWKVQRLPRLPGSWALNAVTEAGPRDVWAAGFADGDQPLLLHFDGTAWTRVPAPPYGGLYGEFTGLAAAGPDDVWAVGRSVLDANDHGHALAAHWDGSTWRQAATPAAAGRLSAVTVTPQGVVAVGRTTTAPFPGPGADGYAMRYADGGWQSLRLPAGTYFDPNGVVADPGGRITVVGIAADPSRPAGSPMVLTGP